MKKGLLLLLMILLLTGCVTKPKQKEKTPVEEEPVEEVEEVPVDTYQDLNETPIGFYDLEGDTLKRLDIIYTKLEL